jgi:hypothetical protein
VVISHGPTHLADLGFTLAEAGAMIALLALISIGGRLVGAVGDFVSPRAVLIVALDRRSGGAWPASSSPARRRWPT